MPAEMSLSSKRREINVAARKAIFEILEPIADFALNCGLSVKDVNSILRQAAVSSIAARQIDYGRRINVSGISATTGLSRAEISKVLRHAWSHTDPVRDTSQNVTNRILAAWHTDSKFLTASGRPIKIKLYGRGPSFESLVKVYGRGIPIRAILEELFRFDAIELKSGQHIIPKARAAVDQRLTNRIISKSGESASIFLSATLRRMNISPAPRILETFSIKLSANNALLLRAKSSPKANALRKQHRSCIPDQSHLDQLKKAMMCDKELAKRLGTYSKKRRNFRRR